MGSEYVERARANGFGLQLMGAEVIPVTGGGD